MYQLVSSDCIFISFVGQSRDNAIRRPNRTQELYVERGLGDRGHVVNPDGSLTNPVFTAGATPNSVLA
jgi:hypothetical protein